MIIVQMNLLKAKKNNNKENQDSAAAVEFLLNNLISININ